MRRSTGEAGLTRSDSDAFLLGDWTIQPQVNRVCNNGETTQIEPKMMELLVYLAASPNRVASRRELLENVWGDVVVGDEVLSRAIFELRRVLRDSTKSPRYIETIHKRGYRLVADVRPLACGDGDVVHRRSATEWVRAAGPVLLPVALVAVLVATVVVQMLDHRAARPSGAAGNPHVTPLTTYHGYEQTPAISPDGNRIAFAWDGAGRDNVDIYVKQITDGIPVRLTTDEGDDKWPAWSPDGLEIGYVHHSGGRGQVCIIDAMGGERRTVPTLGSIEGGFDWSPAAPVIVCAERPHPGAPARLATYDLHTGARVALAAASVLGDDVSPAFSPDGSSIAFVRKVWSGFDRVCTVASEGGSARTVTDSLTYVADFAWYPDGRSVLCTAWFRGEHAMWRVHLADGTIERFPEVGRHAIDVAIQRGGHRLVYQEAVCDASVWRLTPGAPAQPLAPSTKMDFHPDLSADGERVAFVSTRSGSYEVWVCGADGSNPFRVTSFGDRVLMLPHWSPDGETIAVTVLEGGRCNMYAVDVASRQASPLTRGEPLTAAVGWSRDGEWIYFASDRAGGLDLWKLRWRRPDWNAAVRATNAGASWGVESHDGRYLYHNHVERAGLFRVPIADGAGPAASERVLENLPAAHLATNWDVCARGVVAVDDSGGELKLVLFDLENDVATTIASLPADAGRKSVVSASFDGGVVLYDRTAFAEADLMLVGDIR